jgi:predicted  nucleic acid-binding Zn-ribbon protein
MKEIIIEDTKVVKLLQQKDEEVTKGRAISLEIEEMDKTLAEYEEEEKKITALVQPEELGEKAEKLKEQINALIKEFEEVAGQIRDIKLDHIPKELEKKHKDLMAEKEKKETERNKVALKVQKIKDRVVPMIKKRVIDQLDTYEDINSAELKDGVCVVGVYDRLEDWKKGFKRS